MGMITLYAIVTVGSADAPVTAAGSFRFYWLPMLLNLVAVIAIFHSEQRFRQIVGFICIAAAISGAALLTFGDAGFSDSFYAVYPGLENIRSGDWGGEPFLGQPAALVWLTAHVLGWFLLGLQIILEERQAGRL